MTDFVVQHETPTSPTALFGLLVGRKVDHGRQHVVADVDEAAAGPEQLGEILDRAEGGNEHCGWIKYVYVSPGERQDGDVVTDPSGQRFLTHQTTHSTEAYPR